MNPSEKPLPHVRALAHLGDAVYELWVREQAISRYQKNVDLHRYTTSLVNAKVQGMLLERLLPALSDAELDIVRRAQNIPVSTGRRANQSLHRKATAFEALVGYWYLVHPGQLPQNKAKTLDLLRQISDDCAFKPNRS